MADIFREIEQGHEAKYKLDEEQRFKVRCRRNRLFGLWAAGRLGFDADEAADYARGLVEIEVESPHADVAAKVMADLRAQHQHVSEREIHDALSRFEREALEQITAVYPMPLDSDHVQVGG